MKFTKSKLIKGIVALLATAGLVAVVSIPLVSASQPRDYDNNAILYGGAYSINELTNKYNHGTNGPHQTPREIQNLYKIRHYLPIKRIFLIYQLAFFYV